MRRNSSTASKFDQDALLSGFACGCRMSSNGIAFGGHRHCAERRDADSCDNTEAVLAKY
jgi:hypothetical protein